jgi:hypothetical protein
MSKREESNISKLNKMFERKVEAECSDLQDVLKTFRNVHHAAADRPVFYWKSLHGTIMKKIEAPMAFSKFRHPLLWAPAAAALLFCLFFFSTVKKTPIPDIAAGYDQDLLIEVDRALSRDCPAALEPIEILAREMER